MFEFVLERRHATAMNATGRRLPLNLLDSAAHSSALGLVVNFELKTRLTDWFKFDTRSYCRMEEDGRILFGRNIIHLVVFIADLNLSFFTRKYLGTFVTSIPGMILQCQKCNEILKLWHLTVRLKIYAELFYRAVYNDTHLLDSIGVVGPNKK